MNNKLLFEISENIIHLFPLFRFLFRSERSEKKEAVISADLRSHTYHLLGMLKVRGPLPISVIGKRLSIAKQNMTKLTDRLIDEGLIERQNDPDDRRKINLVITGKGAETLKAGKTAYKEIVQKNLSRLTNDDLAVLNESLKSVLDILNKIK